MVFCFDSRGMSCKREPTAGTDAVDMYRGTATEVGRWEKTGMRVTASQLAEGGKNDRLLAGTKHRLQVATSRVP